VYNFGDNLAVINRQKHNNNSINRLINKLSTSMLHGYISGRNTIKREDSVNRKHTSAGAQHNKKRLMVGIQHRQGIVKDGKGGKGSRKGLGMMALWGRWAAPVLCGDGGRL